MVYDSTCVKLSEGRMLINGKRCCIGIDEPRLPKFTLCKVRLIESPGHIKIMGADHVLSLYIVYQTFSSAYLLSFTPVMFSNAISSKFLLSNHHHNTVSLHLYQQHAQIQSRLQHKLTTMEQLTTQYINLITR